METVPWVVDWFENGTVGQQFSNAAYPPDPENEGYYLGVPGCRLEVPLDDPTRNIYSSVARRGSKSLGAANYELTGDGSYRGRGGEMSIRVDPPLADNLYTAPSIQVGTFSLYIQFYPGNAAGGRRAEVRTVAGGAAPVTRGVYENSDEVWIDMKVLPSGTWSVYSAGLINLSGTYDYDPGTYDRFNLTARYCMLDDVAIHIPGYAEGEPDSVRRGFDR